MRLFYQKLFTATESEKLNDSFLDGLILPQISEEDKQIIDSPLAIAEIEIAINQLKREKVPGINGLPIEFYQAFLKEIKHNLHRFVHKNI